MKLSFATLGCPGWSLEQIARNAKALGFDGVELRGVPGEHIGPEESDESIAKIRGLFGQAGVEIACIMGYSRFTWDDEKKRKGDVEAALKFVNTARKLGCPTLRLFGGTLSEAGRPESLRRVVECLKTVAPAAEKAGVRLALETHDDWCHGEDARAVVDGVGSPALGICWDIANPHFIEPMKTTFEAIKAHIVHVHFKDAAKAVNGGERSKLPGEGEVPMKEALRLLHGIGYAKYLSFEWEKKWEPALEEPEVAFPHYVKFTTGLMKDLKIPRG